MSKDIYIGVDGKARKAPKLYIGVDNVARKVLKGYIGDDDGKARQFYSGKYHWWIKSPAVSWTMIRGSLGTNVAGGVPGQYAVSNGIHYVFDDEELSTYSGTYTFTNPMKITLNDAWNLTGSDGDVSYYSLKNDYCAAFTPNPYSMPSNPSNNYRTVFDVDYGAGTINGTAEQFYIYFVDVKYAYPNGHSFGTPVKGTIYRPPIDAVIELDRGYSYYSQKDSSGNELWREYDGDHWEYDGYHE